MCQRNKKNKNCVQRTNIQNLKAIHNEKRYIFERHGLCSKNEYTKSESNSQLCWSIAAKASRLCSKNEYTKSESNSQLHPLKILLPVYCVQRTNIQNLKAIHNRVI